VAHPQSHAIPAGAARALYRLVLLAALALGLTLMFGSTSPVPAPDSTPSAQASSSRLSPTQPGLSRDEGVFLVTDADDGSRGTYFIANGSRHSILWTDVQIELQLNPLWPVRAAARDEVEAYAEGGPIGGAKAGLLGRPMASDMAPQADAPEDDAATADAPTDAAAAAAHNYTVQPGDSAFKIARRFGIGQKALLEANGISNPNRVYVGQVLTIPSS
jgi:LysM domain